jgi:opacity protein-like surface antigen
MSLRIVWDSSGQRRRWVRLGANVLVSFFVLLPGLLGAPSNAWADGWGFAWELGAITATPKGNPFVFRLSADKSYSEEFSIGPSFYLTPYGDNGMYSGSMNAQFHVALQEVRVSPFLGVGVAHRTTKHDNDTALMVPMGLSVSTPIGEKLYLVGTFGINLHSGITLEGRKDGASVGLTAGIGYGP